MAATPVSRQCPSGSYVPIAPKQSTQHTTRAIGRGAGNIPSKLGKIDRIHVLKPIHGSSPRGRGKQVVAMYKQVGVRFVPACAGKTNLPWNCSAISRVDPSKGQLLGSSPRARGETGGPRHAARIPLRIVRGEMDRRPARKEQGLLYQDLDGLPRKLVCLRIACAGNCFSALHVPYW